MPNNVRQIKALVPSSGKTASIEINYRNLIITGVNGCGKTQFINGLFEYLTARVIGKQNASPLELQQTLDYCSNQLSTLSKASSSYETYLGLFETTKATLLGIQSPPVLIDDYDLFTIDYHNHRAVLLKFEATRQAIIRPSDSSKSVDHLREDMLSGHDASSLFEDYLVSQKTAQAYAESPSIGNNLKQAKLIGLWFDKLEADLQELFEDPTLKLVFQYESQSFYIKQEGKSRYRLQQLSSGFSSIFSIYAALLTRIQLSSVAINEVYGVVFIDEIDAHLHVTLQRKILSFLTTSFPKIQFIVSTHSPFVVSSVKDAVIYDLSTFEQVDDLSMYSYESILSGLFNTAPISEVAKEMVIEMGNIMTSPDIDIVKLERYVHEIGEHEKYLDSESAFYVKKARIIVNKSKMEGE